MKLICLMTIVILMVSINTKQYSVLDQNNNSEYERMMKNSDKTLEVIRDYMLQIAENMDRKSNIKDKKIRLGILPDEYPEAMKRKALKVRNERKEWEKVMLYPTEVWRMCVFPNFKINYVSWCKQNLALTKTKIKLNSNI